MKRPDVIVTTMTEKLLTYALGRGLEYYDMPAVRAIVRNSEKDGYRFSTLVREIVRSTPFTMRRAEAAAHVVSGVSRTGTGTNQISARKE
jgi:hypothetical protein